jgi:hypothetical protein
MAGICLGNNFPDCTTDYIIPDPDIAGIGVIVSFAVGNGLTVVLSLIALFFIKLEDLDMGGFDLAINKGLKWLRFKPLSDMLDDETMNFWLGILEKVILGLSDTQLLTGIAILIAGYVKCSISVYHSSIVSDLAWFASGTHLSTLQVLRHYMIKHPAIRLVRVILLLAMGGLLISLVVYQGNQDWYLSPATPAQCLFADTLGNIGGTPAAWMGFNMFFIVLGYGASILSLYPEFTKSFPASHIYLRIMRRIGRSSRQLTKALITLPNNLRKFHKITWYQLAILTPFIILGELGMLVCAIVLIVTWAVMYFFSLMIDSYAVGALFDLAWFGDGIYNVITDRRTGRSLMSTQDQSVENQWGFGQLVPCLLLLLPLMTMFEIWYGKYPGIIEIGMMHTHELQKLDAKHKKNERRQPRSENIKPSSTAHLVYQPPTPQHTLPNFVYQS